MNYSIEFIEQPEILSNHELYSIHGGSCTDKCFINVKRKRVKKESDTNKKEKLKIYLNYTSPSVTCEIYIIH